MRIKLICSLVLLILVGPATAKAQTEQWVARYNGQGGANAIAVDSRTSNVYATGFSWGGATLQDYATVAYDAAGTELWVARYDGPTNTYDVPSAITVDNNTGNVYVTGRSEGIGTGYDYATVAYDSRVPSSGSLATMDREMGAILRLPSPWTARATSTLREAAGAEQKRSLITQP